MLRWAFILVGLLAVTQAHADGYMPTSWGFRVTLKYGATETGYTSWYDGGSVSFYGDFLRAASNHPWILDYPRKTEIPKVDCGVCTDQVFLLWADYHIWLGDRTEGPGLPPTNDLGLFKEFFSITSPVTVTAFVKESIEDIPFGKIKSIEMEASKSEKVDMCIPTYDAKVRDTLLHGKVLHRIEEGGDTFLFYDPAFGPVEWLSDEFCGDREVFNGKVDGYALGEMSGTYPFQGAMPIPESYFRPEAYPDSPMFRALADLVTKKVWQQNHLRSDWKKYRDYANKNFQASMTKPIPGLIWIGGCDSD